MRSDSLQKENPSPGADRDGLKENLERDKLNMSQKAYDGKSLPSDLHQMTVMAVSVLQLEELLTEIQAERSAMQRLVLAYTQVLKAFSDLYLELCGKTEERRFLERSMRRAEREAARLRLPLWFWRPEPGLELKAQLYRRAKYLIEQECSLDDQFDLLREFVDEWARPETPVTDEQISGIIEFAYEKGVN